MRPGARAASLAACLLLPPAAACAPPPAPAGVEMRVEADVFSGQPNPAWILAPDEARAVAGLLGELRPSTVRAETFDGLGYRGMLLTGAASHLGGCDELRAYRGRVVGECPDGERTWDDPGRRLERRLLESGRERLPPDLLEYLRGEVGG
jgi:hypothetical protein